MQSSLVECAARSRTPHLEDVGNHLVEPLAKFSTQLLEIRVLRMRDGGLLGIRKEKTEPIWVLLGLLGLLVGVCKERTCKQKEGRIASGVPRSAQAWAKKAHTGSFRERIGIEVEVGRGGN